MKRIKTLFFAAMFMAIAVAGIAADQRIQYNEYMVGANHPTETDTLNRLPLVEHNTDGTHKTSAAYDPAGTAAGKIASSISDGDTTHAPDGNSVYDALAGKAPSSGIALTALATQAAETILANATSGAASPTAIAISEQQVAGRITGGHVKGLSVAELQTLAAVPVKASGAELDTGTDDAKFATAKALKDSHNVPSVVPGTSGNVLTSNGADWTSATPTAVPVKASGAEITTGTDDAKFATAKAIKDANIIATPVKAIGAEITSGIDDAKFATAKSLRDADVGMWKTTTGTFTARPPSTSTITMTTDLTAALKVGLPLRYTWNSNTYYGRVAAIASNLLTVNGAPLSTSYDVTALSYGMPSMVRQVNVIIPGTYEDASNTALIASDLKSSLQWSLPVSYLVYYRVYSNTHDTGTHGQASVRINGTEVNTTTGGLTIAADATWYSTIVDIATAAYDVNPGEAIEVTAVKAGNGDAADLTAQMIFVTP